MNRSDIKIQIGLPWSQQLTIKQNDGSPLNLTGYTGKCQVRRTPADDDALFEITVTIADAANGVINLYLAANATSSYTQELVGLYDVFITSASNISTLVARGSADIKFWQPPSNYTTSVTKGETWQLLLTIKNQNGTLKNLSGYTFIARVRNSMTDAGTLATATVNVTGLGTAVVYLTNSQTGGLDSGRYVYEVAMYNGTEAIKLLGGEIAILGSITTP
jgi:hypothetical protein